jgi:DNA-binding CsgD family transcriptional regulator
MTVLDLVRAGPGPETLEEKGHLPLCGHETSASEKHPFEPALRAHPSTCRATIDEDSLLARAARALLAEVATDLAGSPFTVVLRDDRGAVVDHRGAATSLSPIGTSSVAPGSAGGPVVATNAIDTAPAQRAAGVVEGAEKFTALLAALAGVAVPVHDPRNGHVIGAVEMSFPVQGAKTLVLALARRVAQEIEQRLLDEVGIADRAILYHFLRERHRVKGPFVFVNERTMVPNAAADRLLGPSDEDLLRHWAAVLAERRYDEPAEVTLGNGATVLVRAEAVRGPHRSPGVLLRLARPRSPSSPTRPASSGAGFGWDSLTETERSVTELVAQGLTNREVGERLFVSRHTVDFRLRCIFRKLGLSSRVELTRAVLNRR